jgi:hypothetical protein
MGKYDQVFNYIRDRLKEPSTLASLAALCGLARINVDMETLQNILTGSTFLFGILGFAIKG